MSELDPPQPVVETRPSADRRVSLVWLVPLLALIISLAVAWRSYSERGPLIRIVFEDAAGIVEGETTLRFRNVTVGMVEDIAFTSDLDSVEVGVRVSKSLAEYIDGDAQFWVVRPRVTAQGISGIETVLSGVYIDAYWDGVPGERETRFLALETPPQTPTNQPGLRVRLRAPDGGSVSVGAPVLYKSIQVGQIETVELADNGEVLIDVFVDDPHHLRLTEATRFWNASGFSVQLGPEGAALNVDSLSSLLQGGIAFDTIGSNVTPVEAGHAYELYGSETTARQNAFEEVSGERLTLDVYFDGSVRGLQPGAPVEFRGIRVGEVTALQAAILDEGDTPRVALRATIAIVPQRLGVGTEPAPDADTPETDPNDAALDLLEAQVARGLRAQLASSGLLTQSLYVDLVTIENAEPASFDRNAEPYPVVPSVPTEVTGIAQSAQGVLERLSSLPIEDLLDNATALLANVNLLITDDSIRAAPENLGLLLADLRALVNESGLMDAPEELRDLIASADALLGEAAERELVTSLADTLDAARVAVLDIGTSVEGLPALIASADAFAANASRLPLDELVATATQLLADIDAIAQNEALTGLPADLSATLAEARGLLEQIETGGAVQNITATLASLRAVADQIAAADLVTQIQGAVAEARFAIATIGTASEDLPALLDSLTAFSDRAAALPLDALTASAGEVLDEVNALLSSEAVAAIPADVSAALAQVQGLLADLRAGGAIENATAALASIRQITEEAAAADLVASIEAVAAEVRIAADNVGTASDDLPALIDSLTRLSERAAELPLDAFVASATEALDGVDEFLGTDGAQSVPASLGATLDEARGLIADLRTGGAVENLNATLASTDQAAAALTTAAAELPALIAQLNQAASGASSALATVSPGSELNRETQSLIRDVREAAKAVNDLVTALERRPNSVLFGR